MIMIGHHDRERIDALRQAAAKKGRVVRGRRSKDGRRAAARRHARRPEQAAREHPVARGSGLTRGRSRIAGRGTVPEGRAHSGSDVDLLVVMPTNRDPIDESVAIRMAVRPPFPVDLLVRTPQMIQQWLALGDPFVRHILEHGKLLYASPDG
jgi:uncharacterized protein